MRCGYCGGEVANATTIIACLKCGRVTFTQNITPQAMADAVEMTEEQFSAYLDGEIDSLFAEVDDGR